MDLLKAMSFFRDRFHWITMFARRFGNKQTNIHKWNIWLPNCWTRSDIKKKYLVTKHAPIENNLKYWVFNRSRTSPSGWVAFYRWQHTSLIKIIYISLLAFLPRSQYPHYLYVSDFYLIWTVTCMTTKWILFHLNSLIFCWASVWNYTENEARAVHKKHSGESSVTWGHFCQGEDYCHYSKFNFIIFCMIAVDIQINGSDNIVKGFQRRPDVVEAAWITQ